MAEQDSEQPYNQNAPPQSPAKDTPRTTEAGKGVGKSLKTHASSVFLSFEEVAKTATIATANTKWMLMVGLCWWDLSSRRDKMRLPSNVCKAGVHDRHHAGLLLKRQANLLVGWTLCWSSVFSVPAPSGDQHPFSMRSSLQSSQFFSK